MTMRPGLRKFALTVHVSASVGWFGAVLAFLALTVIGLTAQSDQVVRAVYVVAEPLTRFAIVPLAVLALLTGVVQALGTPWGLIRHYWVLFKLVLTLIATIVLLQYVPAVAYFAAAAAEAEGADPVGLWSYLLHSGLAVVLLLVTTTLSVYKPQGVTPFRQARK